MEETVWTRALNCLDKPLRDQLNQPVTVVINGTRCTAPVPSLMRKMADWSLEPLRFHSGGLEFTLSDGRTEDFMLTEPSLALVREVHRLTGERADGVLAIKGEEHCTCEGCDPFVCPKCEEKLGDR